VKNVRRFIREGGQRTINDVLSCLREGVRRKHPHNRRTQPTMLCLSSKFLTQTTWRLHPNPVLSRASPLWRLSVHKDENPVKLPKIRTDHEDASRTAGTAGQYHDKGSSGDASSCGRLGGPSVEIPKGMGLKGRHTDL